MTMPFPKTPPPAGSPKPWSFPAAAERDLASGLRIIAVRMPALPMVHLRWTFRGGRAAMAEGPVGVARLLSATARHGTERYDSAGLAEALDALGARLNFSIGADATAVTMTALSEHLPIALDLLDQVALAPTCPPADLERERATALEGLRQELNQPGQLAGMWLGHALYGDHPYGRIGATEAGLRATTRDQVLALHQRLCQPAHALLVATGDFDAEATADLLAARYAHHDARCPPTPAPAVREGPATGPRRVILIDRPGSAQVTLSVGQLAVRRGHDDYLALRLVNQVLGAGPASRLFLELRERRSLTYGCYSSLDSGRWGGDLSANLSCAPEKTREAAESLLQELERIRTEPISAADLDEAQRYVIGSFPRKASGVGGVASLVGATWLHSLAADTWSRYQQAVADVDAQTASAAAALWIRPAATHMVAVGPGDVLQAVLGDLGAVELRSAGELP